MKKTMTLALALATFGNLNAFASETTQIDGVKNIMCTMEYAPVCGEKNGAQKTYGNSCGAGVDGAKVLYNGECKMENIDGNYKLKFFDNKPVSGDYNLSFEAGQINAKICNSIFGAYKIENGKIIAPKLGSTLMLCNGEAGNIEAKFLLDNATIQSFPNTLDITTASGTKMHFEKISQPAQTNPSSNLVDSSWILKKVNFDQTDLSEKNIELNFSKENFSFNPCNSINGKYSFSQVLGKDEISFQASELVSTRMACTGIQAQIEKDMKNWENATLVVSKDGQTMSLKTPTSSYEFVKKTSQPAADFDFQGNWKIKSYNSKDISDKPTINFSKNEISLKLCNSIFGTYKIEPKTGLDYSLKANLSSTKMACVGQAGEIEKLFDLSDATINLPMDTVNYFRITTKNGDYFELERESKKPSVYPTPKTQNGYINFRANKLFDHLVKYMNKNGKSYDDIKTLLQNGIEKINQLQKSAMMTQSQNSKLETRKKVYQNTIDTINNNSNK